jgi:HSP90 family molecular chaperone
LSIDAPIQYYALLYIPQKITNEVLYAREGKGLALYAQKVLIPSLSIMAFSHPTYASFKGVG